MPDLHSFETVTNKLPRRSTFDMPNRHTFTLSEGSLYPCYVQEVLPVDTWKVQRSVSIRNLQTQVHCVEDDAFIDFWWFFVPKRLIWSKWSEIYGDGSPDDWTNPSELVEPGLTMSESGHPVGAGSVLNGLGLPVGLDVENESYINGAILAGYVKIRNDWFRDENVENADPFADIYYNAASGSTVDLQEDCSGDYLIADLFPNRIPDVKTNYGVCRYFGSNVGLE